MLNRSTSKKLFSQASKTIPGGVNSPVRAFKSVGGDPLFIKSAKGAYLYDEDGNQLIDLINSWGPMILGHANPDVQKAVADALPGSLSFGAPTRKEIEMAELICDMVPSVDMVRMVNSGTEATMSAIRLARGYTAKNKIIKFAGCYHGHGDSFLIAAGSGAATMGIPNSPGVTENTAKDTLVAPYNNLDAVNNLVENNKGDVAAIIIEPVAGNMGCVLPQKGFLEGLRKICDKEGIVLIFDEVMTGFRLSPGGAQQVLEVLPDLTTLGKIIGGGMPVGAYGGKKEIMSGVAPAGPVYQAGTLSGNPIAMAAGHATLHYLHDHPEVYLQTEKATADICAGFRKNIRQTGKHYQINQIGSMMSMFFTETPVYDFDSASTSDTALFGKYFNAMLEKGVYNAPSQFEALFISTAIEGDIVDRIIEANKASLQEILS